MSHERLVRPLPPYPTDERGVPCPPYELVSFPASRLPETPENMSNHHLFFPACEYQYLLNPKHSPQPSEVRGVYGLLRNLAEYQIPLRLDQHNAGKEALHRRYGPPPMPSPYQALELVNDAYIHHRPLRIGSANRYQLFEIEPPVMNEAIVMARDAAEDVLGRSIVRKAERDHREFVRVQPEWRAPVIPDIGWASIQIA